MKTQKLSKIGLVFLVFGGVATGCSYLPKGRADFEVRAKEQGTASWYGDTFHGQVTASGEVYDEGALTGAHRTLPFGTIVKVTNANNGLHVKVRINDRGPYFGGRILDMSHAAATKVDLIGSGIAPVRLEVVGEGGGASADHPGTWEVFRGLMRKVVLTEAEQPSPARQNLLKDSSLVLASVREGEPRRTTPWDIVLERRLRREADPKPFDTGEEGGSEPELT